jgi:polyhydroxybutyrate depolymerase
VLTLGVVLVASCRNESPKVEAAVKQPERPVRAFRAAKSSAPAPLIILLHGYGGDGPGQMDWFGMTAIEDAHVIAPDGTLDQTGRRFWNANSACCDFEAHGVDDVKYVLSLIDDVAAKHPTDRARVYAMGVSNGGAMALRLACDAADKIAGIVTIAAPVPASATCTPSRPVAIRQLHGTADHVVPFAGGTIVKGIHPKAPPRDMLGAQALSSLLVKASGCSALTEDRTFDVDRSVPGEETTVARAPSCNVEFWTLRGSAHVPPPFTRAFVDDTWSFLSAHKR